MENTFIKCPFFVPPTFIKFPFLKEVEDKLNTKSNEVKETVKETVSNVKETVSKVKETVSNKNKTEEATVVEESK